MSFDESKVLIVRLTSNEEVLGLVTESEDGILLVKCPFAIGIAPNQKGTPNVHLAPYLYLMDEDETLPLLPSIIAFKYKPNKDVIAKYKEIYLKMTSGLILPPDSKGIV